MNWMEWLLTFKHSMGIKTANYGRLRRIRTSFWALASNAEQIGDQIAINQECGVGDKDREVIPHIKPLKHQISLDAVNDDITR